MQEGYSEAESDKESILAAIDIVSQFFVSELTSKFLRKKTQLYTLFCVAFYINRDKISLDDRNLKNFDSFVSLYSVFSNDMDLSEILDDTEKVLFDKLKKYKLASSEGLNKHTNRMIRYNVMKDFIFNINDELQEAEKTLMEKMQAIESIPSEDPEE